MIRREVQIGDCRLLLGDCLEIVPTLGRVHHMIFDPPYEATLHAAKNSLRGRKHRNDGVAELKGLDFAPIDAIRDDVVRLGVDVCDGWFIAFCTPEGIAKWADSINASSLKYKRACVWVKPDSTPQLNGQGPAQGAENFITAWAGRGYSQWNGGGKRGVYTHCVNVNRHGAHPTEKPVPLMRELVADFTQRGQTILDPFMGSGTTGIACLRERRQFIGIELSEEHFETAVERISDAYSRPDMFIEAERRPEPKQEALSL